MLSIIFLIIANIEEIFSIRIIAQMLQLKKV